MVINRESLIDILIFKLKIPLCIMQYTLSQLVEDIFNEILRSIKKRFWKLFAKQSFYE